MDFLLVCGLAALLFLGGFSAKKEGVSTEQVLRVQTSLCFVWLAVGMFFALLAPDYQFLIGTHGDWFFFQQVFSVLSFVSGAMLAVRWYRKTAQGAVQKAALAVCVGSFAALLLFFHMFLLFFHTQSRYSFFSSHGSHAIVVEEDSFLLAGWVSVYQRVNPFFVRLAGKENTDDGYRPIQAGDYAVTWSGQQAVIQFGDGAGKQKEICLSFAER